jgi:hypothetical protein
MPAGQEFITSQKFITSQEFITSEGGGWTKLTLGR